LRNLPPIVAKLVPRLASTHDGEVVATARAIERALRAASLDWHDLVARIGGRPAPERAKGCDWPDDLHFCTSHIKRLPKREADFITSLAQWRGHPTEKQLDWLQAITDRLRVSS
jgi:hypothetical protein